MQRPVRARMGFALAFAPDRARSLPPQARRQARIIRRLGRLIQLGPKFSVLRPKFSILSPQRNDLRRQSLNRLKLHQDDADQSFSIKRIKSRAVQPQFESVDDSAVKRPKSKGG